MHFGPEYNRNDVSSGHHVRRHMMLIYLIIGDLKCPYENIILFASIYTYDEKKWKSIETYRGYVVFKN